MSGNFMSAQTFTIKGTVTDTLNRSVPYVNVFLKTTTANNVVAFTSTNNNGEYNLEVKEKGDFEVNFSSISYQTNTVPITIETNTIDYTVNTVLKEEHFTLDEVIINSEKAITVKEDTIIYRASAFKKGNEENVEDLLQNIPGINVDTDGTIKVGNKEIEKLLIEGDDLFGKGYKLLSKNLDASTVSKVEVYDNYSENRLLKNVENSDKVAINLKLNGDNNKLFGVLKPGYGLGFKNRYDSKANLIFLNKKSKHYVFTDFNNVGFDSTSELSLFDASQNIDISSNATNLPTARTFIRSFQRPRELNKELSNFNNSEMASLNDIFTINEKIKIKTNILFNWDEKEFINENRQVFSIDNNPTFTNDDSSFLKGDQFLAKGNVNLKYDISSDKLFEYTGEVSSNTISSDTDLIFNNIASTERLVEDQVATSHSGIFTKKINESSVFQLKGDFSYSRKPQNYTTNQFAFEGFFDNAIDVTSISQNSKHSLTFFKLESDLLKKLKNKRLLKVTLGSTLTQNTLNSDFQLRDDNEVIANVLSDDFQNDFQYNLLSIYAKANYNYKIGILGINGALEVLHNRNYLKNNTTETSDHSIIINPSISVDLSLNKNNKFTSSIELKSDSPTLRNVTEGYVLTDFNNFSRGNPTNLDQLQSLHLFANYTLGNILSPFFSNTSLIYQKSFEYYTSDNQITSQFAVSDQFIENGRTLFIAQTEANLFVDFLESNLKVKGSYTNQHYQNSVNNSLRDISSTTFKYGLELRTAFSGNFNFHIGTSWSDNRITINQTDKNMSNQSFVDVVYTPIKKVNLSVNMERYTFNSLSDTNPFYFADFKTSYQVIKNKLSVSIEGKNLFNVQNYNSLFINDTGFTNSSYRLLPRYVLLKARIKI